MNARRRVPDGSDIWHRIITESAWTTEQITVDRLSAELKLSHGELMRGLNWAYEEQLAAWVRDKDSQQYWYRPKSRKIMLMQTMSGDVTYCATCLGITMHKEGCINAGQQ